MKKHIKSVISLTIICAVVAILLGITNDITAPIIEKQESDAVAKSLVVVMPNGQDFQSVDISSYELPDTITEIYSEKNGGYVFKMTTSGYASGMVILCGVDGEGKVTGATCIASSETNGAEKDYGGKLVDKTLETVDSVDTVSGSTKTTLGYRNAVKDALNSFVILSGGSVDLRSEEEILKDNLNTALPAGEGKFTSVFITEEIGEISAVYSADNGAGFVFQKGENFVATDLQGNVTSTADEALKNEVGLAAQKIISSKLSEIDITKYADISTSVEKAYKTQSGNYVLELKAAGFGLKGDKWYNPSGEYIKIKVSLTADGKIIACQTVYQSESEGFGAACGEASFYTQFNGKNETNYGEIDAISGATITTNAYKAAIAKAFETVKILKGEL